MLIGIVGPIATADVLTPQARQQHPDCPNGRAGAPLISTLIQEYIRRGHQVVAITIDPAMNDDEPPYVYTDPMLTYIVAPSRQRTFRPNGRRMGRTSDFYRFERAQIVSQLVQYKPDVVHAHWTYEFALAALTYDPDALITVHDNARTILTYIRTLERVFMLLLSRYVFRRGRQFTAVSPYMAKSVQSWTKALVHVVGNPIDIPVATVPRQLPNHLIVSMVVNGWERRKNSPAALLAFKAFQQQHPEAVLWGIGNIFEPGGEAAAFCQAHNIPNVVFFGSIRHADVMSKVSQTTMLLHTSLEESFGMGLAEAMSYGVPVVAGSRSGAVPWVVGDSGVLVDVTDVQAITSGMNQLIADPEQYEQRSASAIQSIRARFSTSAIAGQYLSLYEQCKPHLTQLPHTMSAANQLRLEQTAQ